MAPPCLGYLFETNSLFMCCTSCLYPLIRDRCGPLGSHQESKKLHPPSLSAPHSLWLSFPCQDAAPHGHASVQCGPVRATLHAAAKRTERKAVRSAKSASNRTEKRERRQETRGAFFIEARVRGRGRHQSTPWVTELKFAQGLAGPGRIEDLQNRLGGGVYVKCTDQ